MAWMPWLRDWVEQIAGAGRLALAFLVIPSRRQASSPDWMAAIGSRTRRLSGSTATETKKRRLGDSADAVTTAGRDDGNDDLDERGTESAKRGRGPR